MVSQMFAARMERARTRMQELGVDVLLLSIGADLPYLTGYEAMPLERLTMLVLPRDGAATLVVPRLEAPRVDDRSGAFALRPWEETEDPVAIVAGLTGRAERVAVGDQTWARFVLALQRAIPAREFVDGSRVTAPLRAVKDAGEVAALRNAAHAVDAVALEIAQQQFSGRREREVARQFVERMLDVGHERANFAIVASGPNGASPHHEPGERVIDVGDVVVCDFGGRMRGYCSDITRTYVVGHATDEFAAMFDVLAEAQARAVDAVAPGVPCQEVDAVARRIIGDAGYGDFFIHRTGHGIGLDAHEEPYLVAGNDGKLEPGNAFSIEPGIYLPGRYGARIEDIVVVGEEGPESLNLAPHHAYVVD